MRQSAGKKTVESSFQALNAGRISSAQYVHSIKTETRKLVRQAPPPKRPAHSSK